VIGVIRLTLGPAFDRPDRTRGYWTGLRQPGSPAFDRLETATGTEHTQARALPERLSRLETAAGVNGETE
jgi:hypothetical protein